MFIKSSLLFFSIFPLTLPQPLPQPLPQNNVVLTEYQSPTLHLDPWKSYMDKKHQEISDKILQKEIERWEN